MTQAESRQSGRTARQVLVLSLLLTVPGNASAERLPLKTYTAADGLPRDQINRIVQDSKGFLWFCNTEGFRASMVTSSPTTERSRGSRAARLIIFWKPATGPH